MTCEYCGSPSPPKDNKCSSCGAPMAEPPKRSLDDLIGFRVSPPAPANQPPSAAPFTYSEPPKSRLVAGLLGIFLGGLGIHRFYLGYTGIGITQIIVTCITFGWGSLWGFIEGILILVGSGITKDAKGQPLA